jgi:hypothetical protein
MKRRKGKGENESKLRNCHAEPRSFGEASIHDAEEI